MKKYSRYNCYKGCTFMLTLSEANAIISAEAEISEDDFCFIEAKVELYKKIFSGFGNTEAEAKGFSDKKKDFLKNLSETDREAYTDNLLVKIEDYYEKAEEEYQNRIHSIHATSKEGYEKGAEPYEVSKVEAGAAAQYPLTRFTGLTNLPIDRNYRCNDDGIYVYDVKTLDYVRVCDALSIRNLAFDDTTITQYIEIEYYEYQNLKKTVKTICMPSEELAKGAYGMLHKIGIVINNQRLLTAFLNDVRSIDHTTGKIKKVKAQLKYGYPAQKDGTLDFSRFIGIGDENKIIPVIEYNRLDNNIFKSCGTITGFIDFLSEVSKGKYQIDFQLVVAASLSSIVMAHVNNNLNFVAPPSYIFIGRTSIGKGILGAIANNIWCAPDNAGSICCSSDSSMTFMYAMKNRLNMIPFVIPDIQDLLDRVGVQGVNDIVFSHSNGQSGGKGTPHGEARDNPKDWKDALISFGESDWFSNNPKICGGADARYTIIHLNVENNDTWLTQKAPMEYISLEKKNYGMLGKLFVEAMKNKKSDDIEADFRKTIQELKGLGIQEKQGNSLALLIVADALAREFGLLPEEWEALSCERLVGWNGVKKVTDSTETMYKLLSEQVFKDVSYVPIDDEMFVNNPYGQTQEEIFKSRVKTDKEVRGRIVWQRKDKNGEWCECSKGQRERSILLIPNLQLQQLFNHLKQEAELSSFGFDKKRWAQNGWLFKNGNEYTFKGKFKYGITRPYDAKSRENYYIILLYEDETDYDLFLDKH